jgi:hypothetical protein
MLFPNDLELANALALETTLYPSGLCTRLPRRSMTVSGLAQLSATVGGSADCGHIKCHTRAGYKCAKDGEVYTDS